MKIYIISDSLAIKSLKKKQVPLLLFVYFSNSRFSLRLVTQTDAFKNFIHPFGVVSWIEDFVDFFLSET